MCNSGPPLSWKHDVRSKKLFFFSPFFLSSEDSWINYPFSVLGQAGGGKKSQSSVFIPTWCCCHQYLHTKHSITVSSDQQEYLPCALWSLFSTPTVSPAARLRPPSRPCRFFPSFTSSWTLPNTCYTPLPLPSRPTALSSDGSLLFLSQSFPPLLSHFSSLSLLNHSIHPRPTSFLLKYNACISYHDLGGGHTVFLRATTGLLATLWETMYYTMTFLMACFIVILFCHTIILQCYDIFMRHYNMTFYGFFMTYYTITFLNDILYDIFHDIRYWLLTYIIFIAYYTMTFLWRFVHDILNWFFLWLFMTFCWYSTMTLMMFLMTNYTDIFFFFHDFLMHTIMFFFWHFYDILFSVFFIQYLFSFIFWAKGWSQIPVAVTDLIHETHAVPGQPNIQLFQWNFFKWLF